MYVVGTHEKCPNEVILIHVCAHNMSFLTHLLLCYCSRGRDTRVVQKVLSLIGLLSYIPGIF